MFSKSFLFAVFCTVTLVQSRVPLAQEKASLINKQVELKNALDDLADLIKSKIAEAKAELDNIKNQLQDQADKIVASIKEGLSDQIGGLVQQLKELKDKAKKLGIDIKDCLADKEQQLTDIPVNFGKQIYQCGKDKVDEGIAIVNDAKAKVEKAIDEVKSFNTAFNACDDLSFFKKLQCQGEVVYNVTKAMVSIPGEISGNVSKAIALISTLQTDLEACGFEKVRQAMDEGQELYGEIKGCIESKIKSSQAI